MDSSTSLPVGGVGLRLQPLSAAGRTPPRATQSGDDGRFVFEALCPGRFGIEAEHVGYHSRTVELTLPRSSASSDTSAVGQGTGPGPGPGGQADASPDSIFLELELEPRVFRVDEVDVRAETVTPLTTIDRASVALPPTAIDAFVGGDLIDAIALVPGVLVSGDRPYFRGLGEEHVTAMIDGVVAREPITGRWVLPPPQSIEGAEVVASAMINESTPSLGGLFAMRLAEGRGPLRARLVVGGDRVGAFPEGARDTDTVTLSASGPTGIVGLRFSGAYRGTATNGPFAFDRGLPEQSLLGIGRVGGRMSGEEAVSLKFTWRPEAPGDPIGSSPPRRDGSFGTSDAAPDRPSTSDRELHDAPWRLSAAVVSSTSRAKQYREHYARSGWVGYLEDFDRYTDFIDGAPVPGRDVYYEGPAHVPIEERRSTLLLASVSHRFGAGVESALRIFYGDHRLDTRPSDRRFPTEESVADWWREESTRANHQEEEFYAVHGDLPELEWARSREGGATLTGRVRIGKQHDVRIGLQAILGRHRYLRAAAEPNYYYGSFDAPLDAVETFAYLEETWFSDARSWMRVSLRHVSRRIALVDGVATGSRWATALSFHQPMTASAAINVEVGQSYQFPSLRSQFLPSTAREQVPGLDVQRVRFAELGFQRHFSKRVVGYVGIDTRQYVDVVFGEQAPSGIEELTGARSVPSGALETRQIQAAIDYQITDRLTGQSSVVWSKTTADSPAGETIEVPWSRRTFARTWLTWRAPRGFSSTLTASWDSGRPYDLCLLPRCASWERIRGELPNSLGVDIAGGWRRSLGDYGIEVSVQIRNLLDLDTPDYSFSVYPMDVTSGHFLGYWDRTGDTGGYLIDSSSGERLEEVDNPLTRIPGRSLLVAVGVSF